MVDARNSSPVIVTSFTQLLLHHQLCVRIRVKRWSPVLSLEGFVKRITTFGMLGWTNVYLELQGPAVAPNRIRRARRTSHTSFPFGSIDQLRCSADWATRWKETREVQRWPCRSRCPGGCGILLVQHKLDANQIGLTAVSPYRSEAIRYQQCWPRATKESCSERQAVFLRLRNGKTQGNEVFWSVLRFLTDCTYLLRSQDENDFYS